MNVYFNTTWTTGGFIIDSICDPHSSPEGEIFFLNITFSSSVRDEFMLHPLIDYKSPYNLTLEGIKFTSFMWSRELIETFHIKNSDSCNPEDEIL